MMAIHLSVSFMPYLEAIIARVMCMNGSAVYGKIQQARLVP